MHRNIGVLLQGFEPVGAAPAQYEARAIGGEPACRRCAETRGGPRNENSR